MVHYDGSTWLTLNRGTTVTSILGGDGIAASDIAGVVTLDIDLAGADDGLTFVSDRLSASIATDAVLERQG